VKLPLMRVLVVVGLTHMLLRHVRNAELLATLAPIAIAPVLARQWPILRKDGEGKYLFAAFARPAGYGAMAVALLVGLVYTAGLVRWAGIQPPEATQPDGAMAYARAHGLTKGRVLNHYGYGGYLIGAGVPTFIDGRGELYGGEFIKKYVETVYLKGDEPNLLESTLAKHDISWTLLLKDQPANKVLARLPGWRQAYVDDKAMIFVRE
jgi:hypothetical protein